MEITQQCVVALTWTLKDTLGEELDVLDDPAEFLIGGHDLLPVIEEALLGHAIATVCNCRLSQNKVLAISTTSCCFWNRASCFHQNWKSG